MLKKMCLLFLMGFSLLTADGGEIKINGIGKMSVKADIADTKLGFERIAKTAQEVEKELSSLLPSLINSLKSEEVEKLETGMVEIYPQHSQKAPYEIENYKGRVLVSFSSPTSKTGKIIATAFEMGANILTQVKVRASDTSIAEARAIVLREASQNALKEADLVLESLNLSRKNILEITVIPSDFAIPIYRNTELATFAKSATNLEILEGEQLVQGQVEMRIAFNYLGVVNSSQ